MKKKLHNFLKQSKICEGINSNYENVASKYHTSSRNSSFEFQSLCDIIFHKTKFAFKGVRVFDKNVIKTCDALF